MRSQRGLLVLIVLSTVGFVVLCVVEIAHRWYSPLVPFLNLSLLGVSGTTSIVRARRELRRRRIEIYGTAEQPSLVRYDSAAATSDPWVPPAARPDDRCPGTT